MKATDDKMSHAHFVEAGFHHLIHKSPSLFTILGQIKLIHVPLS